MKKIGIVTGTRAEYGLLKPVMQKIKEDQDLKLCLIVTGMHLSEQFGYTYKEIEKDGFHIDYINDMKLTSDTSYGICRSMGIELGGFAEIFEKDRVDLLVLLGDRYEIQIAAVAAVIYRIPIAHIHGGELTEGLIDDVIRHSVTKMSELHFTSTKMYAKRVMQMGEQSDRVFCVGALGTENIKRQVLFEKDELCKNFGDIFTNPYIMVTYHPVTLENNSAEWQFENLLNVISRHNEFNYIFTYANSDMDGKIINEMIEEFVKYNENAKAFKSMGQIGYLSALKYCEAVIGNSSSGIIEAPSFHIPTMNIGERQMGRVRAETVIDCGYSVQEIEGALDKIRSREFKEFCQKCDNPYEGIDTSGTIVQEIKKFLDTNTGNKKKFYDIEFE